MRLFACGMETHVELLGSTNTGSNIVKIKTLQYALFSSVGLLAISLASGAAHAQAGAASYTFKGSDISSSSNLPTGEGKSRLPLIDASRFPLGGREAAAVPSGEKGAATRSSDEETDDSEDAVSPNAYGSSQEKWPYTTSRVAVQAKGNSQNTAAKTPVTSLPYRLTGKLWVRFDAGWFVCTASLIKKNVLISAAHCVHNYGKKEAGFGKEARWYPANISNSFPGSGEEQPYGEFIATKVSIPSPYFDGTDTCAQGAVGVVCNNDIAVIVLKPRDGKAASQILGGTYSYGWNGYSFIKSPAFGKASVAAVTQLGYPVAFDGGYQMQRTDSFGKYVEDKGTNGKPLKNTQLGSAQTGGSSGGPWLVNFGTKPKITEGEATPGNKAQLNTIVGMTSWGYTQPGPNVQGASWLGVNTEYPKAKYGNYGAGNVGFMVQEACKNAGAC